MLELKGGVPASVAGDDDHLLIDDDGLLPAELLDGGGDLVDCLGFRDPRVLLVGRQLAGRQPADLHSSLVCHKASNDSGCQFC